MIVLQQMTTVWFLKNMGGITMKKRIKSIGMTAGLLAVLAGCGQSFSPVPTQIT